MKHVHTVIKTIAPHDSQERFEGLGVSVFREHAHFLSPKQIKVGETLIKAKNFVIATGAKPQIPDLNGLDKSQVLTNETIFELTQKPSHLVIIGAGPIGIEMAQAFKRLGSKVSIIEQGAALQNDDPDLSMALSEILREEGVKLYENVEIKQITHLENNAVNIDIQQNEDQFRIDGSHILIAAGRTPNTDSLSLDKAHIEVKETGISVDDRLRTTQKHIFAAGDVANGPNFTHVASHHAGVIIKNIIFKIPAKVNYKSLPWVTYSSPELANVGMSEKQARKIYGDSIVIVKSKLKENDRAKTEKHTQGLIKVVTKKNGLILGASILAPHAGELINLWGLAIKQKHKISALADMIIPYPTYSELSKRAAGAWYTPALFSAKTRLLASLLQKLPF